MLKKIFALVLASIMLLGAVALLQQRSLPRNETVYFGGQQWGPINGYNPLSSNMNNSLVIAAAPRGSRDHHVRDPLHVQHARRQALSPAGRRRLRVER